jgi:DNA-binding NtrC family response regulator
MTEPGVAAKLEKPSSMKLLVDSPVRVLVVDDEAGVRNAVARVLRHASMIPVAVESGADALEWLAREPFDVALLDVRMPGMTGPQLLPQMKAARYRAEVIMMSAFADIATVLGAVKDGAYGFLTKPFVSNAAILIEVTNAARYKRLRERTERLQRELADLRPGELIGLCAQIREVNRIVGDIANDDRPVLVVGESGTGKNFLARAIHRRSRRASREFVSVNCAAIAPDRITGDLFGDGCAAGLFERADGGTLVLDGIGDLPIETQAKVRATIANGELRGTGKRVDVRVIGSTNSDLRAFVATGSFRSDLFDGLSQNTIQLPPLREREDDVLCLAQHFVRKFAERIGRQAPRLGPDAARCLERYTWPGNVRELEHVIERALVLDGGDILGSSSFPHAIADHGRP